jgi:site-specific DNA-adenine methylase
LAWDSEKMLFIQTKDERLLAFYENIRQQVDLDMRAGGRHRFAGQGVKQYAEKLREEMDRRRLRFKPIDWNL